METNLSELTLQLESPFNFLASLINGNGAPVFRLQTNSWTFNFLASLINGNIDRVVTIKIFTPLLTS